MLLLQRSGIWLFPASPKQLQAHISGNKCVKSNSGKCFLGHRTSFVRLFLLSTIVLMMPNILLFVNPGLLIRLWC